MGKGHYKKLLLIGVALMVFGCGGNKRDPLKDLRPAEGDMFYGGTFHYNEVENLKSLYPLSSGGIIHSAHILGQIYEGLIGLSQKDLSIVPRLAEKWEMDSTATIYTFHLRKDVNFHDDPCFDGGKGRNVTAKDFKFSFDKLCTASANNKGFWIFKNRVIGADSFYQSTMNNKPLAGGVEGVKVIDDYTLEIHLMKPFASFLQVLAMPYAVVLAKEAFDKYGEDQLRMKCVGTGPFKLKEQKENEAVILVRNDNYWGKDQHGNQLPYLDAIKVSFIKEKKAELLEFKKGNLDMLYKLPLEMIDEILDKRGVLNTDYSKYALQKVPSLSIEYYGFLHASEYFENKLIRQAFNYAIDRRKIVDFTLKGTAIQAVYGIVPPALVGYDTKAIKGYDFNPDKAKQLLAEAGYPNGEGFPEITLVISRGGGSHEQLAEAIQKMLKENLNINLLIESLPMAQLLEKRESGKAMFWRRGWIADYPDPENFLNLLYGIHIPVNSTDKSYMNNERYYSSAYDSLITKALTTIDPDERNMLYLQADQTLMDDAAIVPLYYEKIYRLIAPYVENFHQNPMEFRDFRKVSFKPLEMKES